MPRLAAPIVRGLWKCPRRSVRSRPVRLRRLTSRGSRSSTATLLRALRRPCAEHMRLLALSFSEPFPPRGWGPDSPMTCPRERLPIGLRCRRASHTGSCWGQSAPWVDRVRTWTIPCGLGPTVIRSRAQATLIVRFRPGMPVCRPPSRRRGACRIRGGTWSPRGPSGRRVSR